MLLLWDQPHQPFQVGFKWETLAGGWTQPVDKTVFDLPSHPFEVEGMAGNCVLIPADALRECGLMDEKKFPHGWGDTQLLSECERWAGDCSSNRGLTFGAKPNTNPRPLHEVSKMNSSRYSFKTGDIR